LIDDESFSKLIRGLGRQHAHHGRTLENVF
jgi:hypothetical protein